MSGTPYDCLTYLQNYATTLDGIASEYEAGTNANQFDGVRPHPVFWSSTNCGGITYPPVLDSPDPDAPQTDFRYDPKLSCDATPTDSDKLVFASDSIQSFFLPGGWHVIFYPKTGVNEDPLRYPTTFSCTQASYFPRVVADMTNLTFAQGTSLAGNVAAVAVFRPPVQDPSTFSDSLTEWKYSMCMNTRYETVGGKPLLSWSSGSTECDTFFGGPTEGLTASQTGGYCGAHPEDSACACLNDEHTLRETFCEPGNTSAHCQTVQGLEAYLPVTCFGRNCSLEGYRFGRMLNQACTVTLCEQMINITGDDILVQGGATLWCGNKPLRAQPTPSAPPPDDDDTDSGSQTKNWLLLALGLTFLVLFLATPAAILTWRRTRPVSQQPDFSESDTRW